VWRQGGKTSYIGRNWGEVKREGIIPSTEKGQLRHDFYDESANALYLAMAEKNVKAF